MMEILSSGQPNVVQDLGRPATFSYGISRSGAMDGLSLSIANLLLGNAENAAGIELALFPFRLRFTEAVAFCVAGTHCRILLDDQEVLPWWPHNASPGQQLRVEAPAHGTRAYLCVSGGLDIPLVLGSRSTELRTGFGGLQGRGLRRGDLLQALSTAPMIPNIGVIPFEFLSLSKELEANRLIVRTMPAAEYASFSLSSQRDFEQSTYQITADANRMGYRLKGASLSIIEARELLSHGIVPGTIQVPPSGQPIIQMLEANTCGGYPKIATVIEVDLWKLGQAPVGTLLSFQMVSEEEAVGALRDRRHRLDLISLHFSQNPKATP